MEFLFLGTGSSAGVPVIGCKCRVCSSGEERLRPSGLLQVDGKRLLIDIGPDFRKQALKFDVDHIDGILLTHTHFDHIAGIDEARAFKRPIPCLLSKASFQELKTRYHYLFDLDRITAKFDFQVFEEDLGEVEFCDIKIGFFNYWQTDMVVTGYRIGNFAYVSDIKRFDKKIFECLQGVEFLVLSALQPEKSTFHLSFEEAVAFANTVGAKKTWLTHLGHFYKHDEMNGFLPENVRVGYDGLQLCMK